MIERRGGKADNHFSKVILLCVWGGDYLYDIGIANFQIVNVGLNFPEGWV